MLFSVEITPKVVRDENELVKRLYQFLGEYVPKRLIYEDKDTIEDCIQDTILFMLDRYKKLDKEFRAVDPLKLLTFNYEKWFFNRARSYISFWIRRISRDRKNKRDYIETSIYFKNHYIDIFEPDYIDYITLETLAINYFLDREDTLYLLGEAESMLSDIGYTTATRYEGVEGSRYLRGEGGSDNNNSSGITRENHLTLIAYALVDEYILETSKDVGIDPNPNPNLNIDTGDRDRSE